VYDCVCMCMCEWYVDWGLGLWSLIRQISHGRLVLHTSYQAHCWCVGSENPNSGTAVKHDYDDGADVCI
jgi:hypothetical protein